MKALVVAGGPLQGADLRSLAGGANIVLAADSGARSALGAGVQPDVVVGDMDSLDASTLALLEGAGCEIVRAPTRKDETDLELALRLALQRGASEIDIAGALGGRIDHTLGNIHLLAMPELAGARVRILDGATEVTLARRSETVRGTPGDLVSLIPLTETVLGIRTEHLEYPLRSEPLVMGAARGISNVLTAPEARVHLDAGLLLVVVTHLASGEHGRE
jgi:thiamine pyrophosphokinase